MFGFSLFEGLLSFCTVCLVLDLGVVPKGILKYFLESGLVWTVWTKCNFKSLHGDSGSVQELILYSDNLCFFSSLIA